jgi:hypothetical protein
MPTFTFIGKKVESILGYTSEDWLSTKRILEIIFMLMIRDLCPSVLYRASKSTFRP